MSKLDFLSPVDRTRVLAQRGRVSFRVLIVAGVAVTVVLMLGSVFLGA